MRRFTTVLLLQALPCSGVRTAVEDAAPASPTPRPEGGVFQRERERTSRLGLSRSRFLRREEFTACVETRCTGRVIGFDGLFGTVRTTGPTSKGVSLPSTHHLVPFRSRETFRHGALVSFTLRGGTAIRVKGGRSLATAYRCCGVRATVLRWHDRGFGGYARVPGFDKPLFVARNNVHYQHRQLVHTGTLIHGDVADSPLKPGEIELVNVRLWAAVEGDERSRRGGGAGRLAVLEEWNGGSGVARLLSSSDSASAPIAAQKGSIEVYASAAAMVEVGSSGLRIGDTLRVWYGLHRLRPKRCLVAYRWSVEKQASEQQQQQQQQGTATAVSATVVRLPTVEGAAGKLQVTVNHNAADSTNDFSTTKGISFALGNVEAAGTGPSPAGVPPAVPPWLVPGQSVLCDLAVRQTGETAACRVRLATAPPREHDVVVEADRDVWILQRHRRVVRAGQMRHRQEWVAMCPGTPVTYPPLHVGDRPWDVKIDAAGVRAVQAGARAASAPQSELAATLNVRPDGVVVKARKEGWRQAVGQVVSSGDVAVLRVLLPQRRDEQGEERARSSTALFDVAATSMSNAMAHEGTRWNVDIRSASTTERSASGCPFVVETARPKLLRRRVTAVVTRCDWPFSARAEVPDDGGGQPMEVQLLKRCFATPRAWCRLTAGSQIECDVALQLLADRDEAKDEGIRDQASNLQRGLSDGVGLLDVTGVPTEAGVQAFGSRSLSPTAVDVIVREKPSSGAVFSS